MTSSKDDFPQIKRDLISKIDKIEQFIVGDPTANPPIKGINQRVQELELVERNRLKNRETMIQMATGSIAIAVGGLVIWVFNAIKYAFIKQH